MLGWTNGDYRSRYMNVSDDVRRTYAPADPTVTIWFFGGSTAFGIGQRDLHTIPSAMAKAAERAGRRVRILNYGVESYVNYQEVLMFIRQLGRQAPPDIVMFYDGANDVGVGSQRVSLGIDDDEISYTVTDDAAEANLRRHIASAGAPPVEEVARATADQYRRGLDLAVEVARGCGVDVASFWQPQLSTQAPAEPDLRLYEHLGIDQAGIIETGKPAHRFLELIDRPVVDLTGILDDVGGPIFFDWAHTNEEGAAVIGTALYERLADRITSAAERHAAAPAAPASEVDAPFTPCLSGSAPAPGR